MSTRSEVSLTYMYHHVFLPPKLPHEDDSKSQQTDILCDALYEVMEQFEMHLSGDDALAWAKLLEMMRQTRRTHAPSMRYILKNELEEAIELLPRYGGILALNVVAQNAGVIVRSAGDGLDKSLCFEAFELSPPNEAVMSTRGRLRRSFPAFALRLDPGLSDHPDIANSISHTIALMSHQAVAGQQPQVRKAGWWHDEDRDTVHPGMVTEFLHGILSGLGASVEVQALTKNCREEVMFHNARTPWRRSPTWLWLRTSLQLALLRLQHEHEINQELYKHFMVYFTAELLLWAVDHELPSEILHTMQAKVVRRLLKLETACELPASDRISKTMQAVDLTISLRWRTIQQGHDGRNAALQRLELLQFDTDSRLHLPELDEYLASIAHREPKKYAINNSRPMDLAQLRADILPDLPQPSTDRNLVTLRLHAFETWMAINLFDWVKAHTRDPDACVLLAQVLHQYHGLAKQRYIDNPEANSLMLLVIMELWVACDMLAISICPLLGEYIPGVARQRLQNLLLPREAQLVRLGFVEDYLERRASADRPTKLLFADVQDKRCFPFRYFEQSDLHQSLYKDVISKAANERHQKRLELQALKAEYDQLQSLYRSSECRFLKVPLFDTERPHTVHDTACERCQHKARMDAMIINVHEWPLPPNDITAKIIIFELVVPSWFGHWRDLTTNVRLTVLGAQYISGSKSGCQRSLSRDPHLATSFQPYRDITGSRIGLLSESKAHVQTHRKSRAIATCIDDDVCLENGLRYRYVDSKTSTYVVEIRANDDVPRICTYEMPHRSKALEKYIFRPAEQANGPPPNTVIAEQSLCPEFMTLHEFKALATLPLGFELQWWSILGHLGAPSLDFKKSETALVIQQCIFQAGPPDPSGQVLARVRPSHHVLTMPEFTSTLLDYLDIALGHIRANWESLDVLALFITIAARVLTSAVQPIVREHGLRFLDGARSLAFEWTLLLKERARMATVERKVFAARCTEAALVCVSTFDLDRDVLLRLLASEETASVLVQCAIMIHERETYLANPADKQVAFLHLRHQRVLHDAYHTLTHNFGALDVAIQKSWSGYEPGAGWSISAQSEHCMTTMSATGMAVHLDLLSGELLVNGLPLNRLPSRYERHPYYKILFGTSEMEVMPTETAGMQFSSKQRHHGFQLEFGLAAELSGRTSDLRLRAYGKYPDDAVYELIPDRVFRNHLPDSFFRDFVHWYNYSSGKVEFCPSRNPWESHTRDRLELTRIHDSYWCLERPSHGSFAVGVHSRTGRALANALSPLAQPPHIHTMYTPHLSTIEVEIPHLRLTFSLRQGQSALRSREFVGTMVDSDQALGTLIGLRNRLVLQNEVTSERVVLVPQGSISFAKTTTDTRGVTNSTGAHDHVIVSVDLDTADKILPFRLDDQLGRLVDNGDLQSKLTLAYLHALTSSSRPDPFTKLTGTEQALTILRSSASRSFGYLTQANVDILHEISNISPCRTFYPANEQVMQTVHWSSKLSFLSQHPDFFQLVSSIFAQAQQNAFLYPSHYQGGVPALDPYSMNTHLLERAQVRSAILWPSEYGAEHFTTGFDVPYHTRDAVTDSHKYQCTYLIASKLHGRRNSLSSASLTPDTLWDFLSTCGTLQASDEAVDASEIRYDGSLLREPSEFLARRWLGLLQEFLTGATLHISVVSLATWLSGLACSELADNMSFVEGLATFYANPGALQYFNPSLGGNFDLNDGHTLNPSIIRTHVQPHLKSFHETPVASWTRKDSESHDEFVRRTRQQYFTRRNAAVQDFTSDLIKQWPTKSPRLILSTTEISCYIRTAAAFSSVAQCFKVCHHNLELYSYLSHVHAALQLFGVEAIEASHYTLAEPQPPHRLRTFISASCLTARPAPDLRKVLPPAEVFSSWDTDAIDTTRVRDLAVRISRKPGLSKFELDYIRDLDSSIQSLADYPQHRPRCLPSLLELQLYLQVCEDQFKLVEEALVCATSSLQDSPAEKAAQPTFWPRIRPQFFMGLLHRNQWFKLSSSWKACIMRYAGALIMLQRARRLVVAKTRGNESEVISEVQNVGHTNWCPDDHPEWLLLEVEGNIMIRPNQASIAMQMIEPEQGRNVSMQLNMGEGKSSTIVPMAACALSDTSQLVRVIVAKPQSKQMSQMMIAKLGGLLHRRIYYMPFARDLRLTDNDAHTLSEILEECRAIGGVLLIQPEHILSLQLMGIESFLSSERKPHGKILMETQDQSGRFARDIIDESDENFNTKYELIYTMGSQRAIEMTPDRWIVIQQILDLIRDLVKDLAQEYPHALEVQECEPHVFPRIRILDQTMERILADQLGSYICEHGLPGLPMVRQAPHLRQALRTYITEPEIVKDEAGHISKATFERLESDDIRKRLLLLRGLLAEGVIGFALGRKRWRVNYGLDLSRIPMTHLAVPYRAKDIPSPRSEFSHPDVAILLTCLSYYYCGMDDDMIYSALERLIETDQKDAEYREWVKDVESLDDCFRQLDGVNLKDRAQCVASIFPRIRHSKPLIDFYLSHLVFPTEMKEFPKKLSASGWDLGRAKPHPTSAFSGTSDSRHLLPLDVIHLPLSEQEHTNALVLHYLLQPENGATLIPTTDSQVAQSLLNLVEGLMPAPRVILDVGAQILELSNLEVAQRWLCIHTGESVSAAIFVNESDELSVIDRNDYIELLQTSPFAGRLDSCLVFLDEAHTRGIDLRLPRDYRAAVTLGPNLTKDRLVQACMRLRKLGHGQSVTFCAPQEIHDKINKHASKPRHTAITVPDVLAWAMHETCVDFQRNLALWTVQGLRFARQEEVWEEVGEHRSIMFSKSHAQRFLEDDAQSLEKRYGPLRHGPLDQDSHGVQPRHSPDRDKNHKIQLRVEAYGTKSVRERAMYEEQERELAPEIEQERQVEEIPAAEAAAHHLHQDVIAFALDGSVSAESQAYMHAFKVLSDISAAYHFDVSQLQGERALLATKDFAQTIEKPLETDTRDSFQRCVRWVLSKASASVHGDIIDCAMIISPFEAQGLLPYFRTDRPAVTMHLYKPRWNMDHVPFDDLQGFSIPPAQAPRLLSWPLATQLNLFAGRLYFTSVSDYEQTCTFLGLMRGHVEKDIAVTADGFIIDKNDRPWACHTLVDNPMAFIRSVLQIRRDGLDYSKTHMGRVVRGDLQITKVIQKDVVQHKG